MKMTDYKKYALGQVENFLYDAMSTDATPEEIYDVIKGVVQDNYYTYKNATSKAYELLALLNGNGVGHVSVVNTSEHSEHYYDYNRNKPVAKTCDTDDTSEECKKSWNDFWVEDIHRTDYTDEELNAMCDKAEAEEKAKSLTHQEAIDAGWKMSDEGIWMSPQKEDKVKKWVLPVEEDDPSGVQYITFPDDLLKAANLKEGDVLEWIDQGDGSFKMIKVTKKEN
jgi:hypothetical protein